MKREIKFRACDNVDYMSPPFTLADIGQRKIEFTSDAIIMQYTGLKDKNEKEIYEGDIVILDHWKSTDLFDYSRPFIVTWYEGEINFKQGEYNNFKGSLQGKLSIEIIGNIYENPELLK